MADNYLNAVEREPVPTRVFNPNASEASYKPKQRGYRKTKQRKKNLLLSFFGWILVRGILSGGFYPGTGWDALPSGRYQRLLTVFALTFIHCFRIAFFLLLTRRRWFTVFPSMFIHCFPIDIYSLFCHRRSFTVFQSKLIHCFPMKIFPQAYASRFMKYQCKNCELTSTFWLI